MNTSLRFLHLEDDPFEAKLVQSMLQTEFPDCEVIHARDRAEFVAALEGGIINIIISDYSLPSFDGMTALSMVREKYPEIPFILMSGTMGEEFAIDSLKSGATDYVLKQRRSRLIPALRRALGEVEERAERKRLEQRFLQAQKMEVVGQLSSGVAHDFNNILGVIIGNNDYMMAQLEQDNPFRKNCEEIQLAAERAAGVSRQLLVFSRNQAVQPVVLDINEVIQRMDKMLYRLIDKNIEMTVQLGSGLGQVKADEGYLGQLLMNLVINAQDAMPEGGKLTIKTENVTPEEGGARRGGDVSPGRYVMLSVRDTGIGMTEEVKARLFEAFFTTKPKGKGTGLGLATCQTIVKQSNAHISVESEPGRGALFKVFFPRVDQPPHPSTGRLASMVPARGSETILIVEDDAALRQMTSMVLEYQGYTVLQADSGQEGLRIVTERRGAPIALVITDVVMPQMGGKAMVEGLKSALPGLKVLFTSGYTDEVVSDQGVLLPGIAFLSKPYTLAALTGKVREVLEAPSPAVSL
jgi:signal transduction histidine kinase